MVFLSVRKQFNPNKGYRDMRLYKLKLNIFDRRIDSRTENSQHSHIKAAVGELKF